MQALERAWLAAFGEDGADLSAAQTVARALLVFAWTIALVRIGKKRFLAGGSALDVVVSIVLGSVLSRTINGDAALAPTLAAGAAIVAAHWLLSRIACHNHALGGLIKGHDRVLVRDGVVDEEALARSHLSEHDLLEDVRYEGHLERVEDVREARIERSGKISVIPKAAR